MLNAHPSLRRKLIEMMTKCRFQSGVMGDCLANLLDQFHPAILTEMHSVDEIAFAKALCLRQIEELGIMLRAGTV